MEASAPSNLPRRIGRYDVLGRLDAGGMAEILLGQLRGPNGFEHPVVIKRILPHFAEDRSFVAMFLDEASIQASVRHGNIVHVHELGREAGELFLVMEYLEGETVNGLLRRAVNRGLTVSPRLCAYVVAEACAGLHAAHELKDASGQPRNIVHRDVSPQNVFLSYDGHVKVLDFGIAKAADRITRTEAGLVKGKFEYMAPEQCRGEPVDRRTDVFALGIVLYEMLTGRRLFRRPNQAATVRAVLEAEIVPPSELAGGIPADVEAVCMKALARSRRRRYQTAAEMRRELMRAVNASDDAAMPEERLAELMHRLFAERIAEKGEMIRRAEHGEEIGALPATAVDVDVELPEVQEGEGGGTRGTSGVHRARSGRRPAIAVAVAVALAAGAVVLAGAWMSQGRGEGEPPPPPRSAPAEPPAPPPATPAPSTEVTLHVDSAPRGAAVHWDGEEVGRTPLEIAVPRGGAPVPLVVSHEGYRDVEERITPDVDQRIRLSLERERSRTRRRRARPRPTPSPAMRADPPEGWGRWD